LARVVGPVVGGVLFQYVGIAAPYLAGAGLVGVALALLLAERAPLPIPVAR
jgi:uncharacterized membrane protein AbrB (regulator of aidB expression)